MPSTSRSEARQYQIAFMFETRMRSNTIQRANALDEEGCALSRASVVSIRYSSKQVFVYVHPTELPTSFENVTSIWKVHTYIHTYIRTYVHTYIRTYVHTYIRTYVHRYIHTYIHTYIRTYVRTHVRTYVRTYVRTCTSTHVCIRRKYTHMHWWLRTSVRRCGYAHVHACVHTCVRVST